MRPLHLLPESYRPQGGIDALSQRRTLGRPDLDFYQLFLRETLQNSWDARTGDGPVHFSIDAWRTTPEQTRLLRDVVLANSPEPTGIRPLLDSGDIDVLSVTDTGTRGLTGPTRADIATTDSNFADLILNTGRDMTKGIGGGTYGFGKAVLFQASRCATIVAYSRTTFEGTPVTRFIALNLGNPYRIGGRRFTGRHWWGADGGDLVAPVEGTAAQEFAAALGLHRLPPGATGTSLMVLAPAADDLPLQDVVELLAEAATDHAWPHMVSTSDRPPDIVFDFACGAEAVNPPDPESDPRLRHFVEAYRRCEELLAGRTEPVQGWPWTVEEIHGQRPVQRLGVLAHRDYPHTPDSSHEAPLAEVALMRSPRLVVRYLEVRAAPSGQATAGVFIADPELDREFASAEPASHDDWRDTNMSLAPYARNPVRQALRKIKERFRRRTTPVTGTTADHHPGTVVLASHLGRLLDGTVEGSDPRIATMPGIPAGTTPSEARPGKRRAHGDAGAASGAGRAGNGDRSTGQRGGRARPRAVVNPDVRIVTVDGDTTAVEFTADVVVPDEVRTAEVTAQPFVVIDSGKESEAPAGAEVPRVISWRSVDEDETVYGPVLTLHMPGTSRWLITVSQPPDTAISLQLQASGGAA